MREPSLNYNLHEIIVCCGQSKYVIDVCKK